MKRTTIYTLILVVYCDCYNTIQHGAEKTFFIGLIAAVVAILLMNASFKEGFRICPRRYRLFRCFLYRYGGFIMNKYRITAGGAVFTDIKAPSPFYALRKFRATCPGIPITDISRVYSVNKTVSLYTMADGKIIVGGTEQ